MIITGILLNLLIGIFRRQAGIGNLEHLTVVCGDSTDYA